MNETNKALRTYVARVFVADVLHQVTVTVDMQGIAEQMAHKALANKSGRTKLAHGYVVVSRG